MIRSDATIRERLATVLFYGIVIVLGYFAFRVVEPFVVPLVWAAVLVVVAHPLFDRLALRWGSTWAALACTTIVTLVLILPTFAAMYAFTKQGIGAVHAIEDGIASGRFNWVNRIWATVQKSVPDLGSASLGDTVRNYGDVLAAFAAARIGWIVSHLAIFFFNAGVSILAMFYLFRDSKSIVARLRDVLPFGAEQGDRMLGQAEELIFASVMSTGAAALAHGFFGAIAFGITGIGAPIFWGVMMAFFSLVPVVGSALIWVPAAVSLMVSGHITRGIVLILICALIVSSVDNVIRPWLISGRAEMGGLVVFVSVLGGLRAFGLLGVVLGPIIVAMALSLLDLYAPGPGKPLGNKAAEVHGK